MTKPNPLDRRHADHLGSQTQQGSPASTELPQFKSGSSAMNIATPAAARKPFFTLPNIVFEDPYFTKEKRVFSRVEAVAWIAKHVRWIDNCTVKRGQGSWSLSYLSEAWGWHISKVRRFLKRLESANVIRTARDIASDTAQTVITYLFATTYRAEKVDADTEPTVDRHSSDTKTNTGNTGKEDSPYSPQGDDEGDYFSQWQTDNAAGAGSIDDSAQPPEDAVPPPNCAGPSPRKPRERKQARTVPEGWQPRADTIEKLVTELGVTPEQLERECMKFIDNSQSKGKTYVELDSGFRNWARNAKGYGHFNDKPAWKSVKEREFSI